MSRKSLPVTAGRPDPGVVPELTEFDVILVSTSAGKDSQAMMDYVCGLAREAGVLDRVVAVHADLGKRVEWAGTGLLAEEQAEHYGIRFEVVSRIGTVSKGQAKGGAPLYDEGETRGDLLDHVMKRWRQFKRDGVTGRAPWFGKGTLRYCTSDHKRGPIQKLHTDLAAAWRGRTGEKRACRILECMGLRAAESKARAKKPQLEVNKKKSSGAKQITEWLPIQNWSDAQVWECIKASGVPYHRAYDLGMPRLSCKFCIYAPREALLIAAKYNPETLDEYCAVEEETGFDFTTDVSLREIREAVRNGEADAVTEVAGWGDM